MERESFFWATFLALFSLVLSHRGQIPPPTPAPFARQTNATTLRPTTTSTTHNYYYDEDDLVQGEVRPITDNPVPADHIPSGLKTSVFGYECTVQR